MNKSFSEISTYVIMLLTVVTFYYGGITNVPENIRYFVLLLGTNGASFIYLNNKINSKRKS